MSARDDKDPLDANLEGAASLLRGLPREAPTASVSDSVVEKVRPEAARRRRLMTVVAVAAVVAGLAYGAGLFGLMAEVP